jgi:hypothetical protein
MKSIRSHFVFSKGGILIDKKISVKPVDRSVGYHFSTNVVDQSEIGSGIYQEKPS